MALRVRIARLECYHQRLDDARVKAFVLRRDPDALEGLEEPEQAFVQRVEQQFLACRRMNIV